MNFPAYLRSLTARFLHRSEVAEEMEEELRSHIQYRADDLERSGLDRAHAERQARIEFGARERFKEECHQAMGGHFFETLVQDVRFAVRVLRKSLGFTFAAVVTLALAIGANAVVFGIMDGLLLRPLNVPQWETLWGTMYGTNPGWQSYPNYVDLRNRNHSFEDLAAFKFAFTAMDTGKDLSRANGFATSGNYFDVLRIQPYLGQVFHGSDEHGPNSAPFIVLTYAYWHSRFHDDRSVIGRVVQLNKHPFTIIGVAPPGFQGTLLFISPDFFMPIVNQAQVDGEDLLSARGSDRGTFELIGHLKPGVTPAQATADMNAVGGVSGKNLPKQFAHQNSSLAHEGLTSFTGPASAFVAGLMLLAGLILLAACANLGSLFAAHAADRSREVALRLALGSSRNRILRQLLTEAVLISLAGGALGLLGSVALLRRLSTWQPFDGAPVHLPVSPDARIYVVALALALVEWIPLRHCSRAPGAQGQSIRDCQSGIGREQAWAPDNRPRDAAGAADCDLCGPGNVFAGRGAWADALAA